MPERCDLVNDALRLIQKTDGLTFGTDALLLAGYICGRYRSGCELGSGSGIISLLLASRSKLDTAVCLEVQKEYAELTERNAELNNLSSKITAVCTDIRDYKSDEPFELVYTNPPYMKATSGKQNALDKKNVARHEVMGDINDFAAAAKRLLKFGGTFAAVYRPDRLADLIFAMRRSSIEPKRLTFVHADADSEPSMVLVEARSGGKSGAIVTKPLIIYRDKEHKYYSDDMNYIMENGSFAPDFRRQGKK